MPKINVITEVQTGRQITPRYHGYRGGFTKINCCTDCGAVGLYEDLHSVNACPYCGGDVKAYGAGRWNGEWGSTGFFTNGWKEGAWEKRIRIEKEEE